MALMTKLKELSVKINIVKKKTKLKIQERNVQTDTTTLWTLRNILEKTISILKTFLHINVFHYYDPFVCIFSTISLKWGPNRPV